MQHADALEAVRRLVRRTFAELGADAEDEFQETILIRHDQYCGRRFQAGDLQAIWFIEEDELKLYSADGTVLRVTSAVDASCHPPVVTPHRVAA